MLLFRPSSTVFFAVAVTTVMACDSSSSSVDVSALDRQELETMLQAFLDERALEETHLATFDALDFDVFSHQEWERLGESHAQDVIVHWPDGRVTQGIDVHIEDLKGLFVWAPDTRIQEHPIRIGDGEFTAVTGFMEGTFTDPMPRGDGTFIEPTGQEYRLAMVTIAHWDNGTIREEWLYWDNQEFFKQIGL